MEPHTDENKILIHNLIKENHDLDLRIQELK